MHGHPSLKKQRSAGGSQPYSGEEATGPEVVGLWKFDGDEASFARAVLRRERSFGWRNKIRWPGNNLVVFAIDADTGGLTLAGDAASIRMTSSIRWLK